MRAVLKSPKRVTLKFIVAVPWAAGSVTLASAMENVVGPKIVSVSVPCPRRELVGVPKVTAIVLVGPGGGVRSVPVMKPLVWPAGMTRGLAVSPL